MQGLPQLFVMVIPFAERERRFELNFLGTRIKFTEKGHISRTKFSKGSVSE